MSEKGKRYECKKCAKEILVMREGKSSAPPICCGRNMMEIASKL